MVVVVVVVVRSRKVFCTLTPEDRSEANEARWWDDADGFGMVAAARPTLDALSFVERLGMENLVGETELSRGI